MPLANKRLGFISGLHGSSLSSRLTHECKLESDGPSDTDPDEAPDDDLEGAVDKDSFVKQQDADLVQAYARPDQNFEHVGRLVQVIGAPSSPVVLLHGIPCQKP